MQCRRPWFDSWIKKIPWGRDRLPTPIFLGFPGSSASKGSACNIRDLGLIPGLGRSAGEGIGYPLPYSWASLVAQPVKTPPAMLETWVRFLGWEDPLDKGKATPVFWSGEFHGLHSSWCCRKSNMMEQLPLHFNDKNENLKKIQIILVALM